jgi:hypothetical protein
VRRSAVLLAAALTAFSVYAQEPQVQAFRLHYHSPAEAAALVGPLLSANGSLLLQPSAETIVVRDRPDIVTRVAATLRAWDVQPAGFSVDLSLLRASATAAGLALTPGIDQQVLAGLRNLFGFRSFVLIDSLVIRATDSTPVETAAGSRYLVSFVPRWSPDGTNRVILSAFELGRRDPLPSGIETVRPIMRRGTVNVRFDQTSVISIARSEEAREALVLVLRARRSGER